MQLLDVVNLWVIPLIILTFAFSWLIQSGSKVLSRFFFSLSTTIVGLVFYVLFEKGLVEIISICHLNLSAEILWLINLMIIIMACGLSFLLLSMTINLPAPPTLKDKLGYLDSLKNKQ